ncbi:MAG: hypothetical protein QGF68_20730, partial [Nitrospinota bacterium]|nr:hypothetical protein [Nitrospinota bacterium]
RREWVPPLLSVILTYMMIYALLHVRNRYRVPVLPLVFVLSAGGFWFLYDLIRTSVQKKLPSGNGTSRLSSQSDVFSPPRLGEDEGETVPRQALGSAAGERS